jgi:hypothetical protein
MPRPAQTLVTYAKYDQDQQRDSGGHQSELGPAVDRIRHPCRLLITGRSTMGKTTLAVDIILHRMLRSVRRCFAVCPTFWSQPALAPLRRIRGAFTNRNVFTQVNDSVFEYLYKIISTQPAPTLILIDDSAADQATNVGNKGSFSRLCISCNHHDTSMVGIFQRLSSASPSFRDNAEGLISFIPTKILDIDIIYKEFNPSPTSVKSLDVVKRALSEAWGSARFAFIWREAFTGRIYYFSGFSQRIHFNSSDDHRERRRQDMPQTTTRYHLG